MALSRPPRGTLFEGAITLTAAAGTANTITVADAVLPPTVAVMSAAPFARASTTPSVVTSATLVADADHVTLLAGSVLPRASRTVATSCTVSPGYEPELAGATLMLWTGFGSTRTM